VTRTLALAALLVLAGWATAWGQAASRQIQARYSPSYGRCMAAPAAKSTNGMLGCIAAETRIQDRHLNGVYGMALRNLMVDQRQRLQSAQRAWIAFRDADCSARVDPQVWGSISRIDGALCVLNRTVQRTIELEKFPPNDR
jgi:uncharacterized protein YecT (DUF1311 family)